jgi:hypothetical protein
MKIHVLGRQVKPSGIARNADPIWLHQNELWEFMVPDDELHAGAGPADDESEIPF